MSIKSISFLTRKVYVKHRLIEDIVRGKNVIHYGCVDDDERLIRHKIEKGSYLHDIVTRSSKKTTGIDLNREAFGFLKKDFSIDNIAYGDVEDPSTFEVDKKILRQANVLLIPDLIEHLNNPGAMLEGIKNNFNKDIKVLILTPNPFAWYNFAATLFGIEIYNDYHTMYFTTQSMSVLLKRHGFKIERITPLVIPKQQPILIRMMSVTASKISTLISPGFADMYMYECVIDAPTKKRNANKKSATNKK